MTRLKSSQKMLFTFNFPILFKQVPLTITVLHQPKSPQVRLQGTPIISTSHITEGYFIPHINTTCTVWKFFILFRFSDMGKDLIFKIFSASPLTNAHPSQKPEVTSPSWTGQTFDCCPLSRWPFSLALWGFLTRQKHWHVRNGPSFIQSSFSKESGMLKLLIEFKGDGHLLVKSAIVSICSGQNNYSL